MTLMNATITTQWLPYAAILGPWVLWIVFLAFDIGRRFNQEAELLEQPWLATAGPTVSPAH